MNVPRASNSEPAQRSAQRLPRRYWAIFLTLALSAAALSQADVPLSEALVRWDWPSDLRKLISLSEAFSHGMGVLVILLTIFVTVPDVRLKMWRLAACPILAGLVSNLTKLTVARYRPQYFYQQAVAQGDDSQLQVGTTFDGWLPVLNADQIGDHLVQSFPSAHTTTAFALAVGLSWAFPRGRYMFFLLAILAGLQRVDSQSHWPSDVVAGAGLGILVGAAVCYSRASHWFFARLENWRAARQKEIVANPDNS